MNGKRTSVLLPDQANDITYLLLLGCVVIVFNVSHGVMSIAMTTSVANASKFFGFVNMRNYASILCCPHAD